MNLYMVVFLAGISSYCTFSGGQPSVEFFTDIKPAMEFQQSQEDEQIGCKSTLKPRIFKIVPRRKKECELSGGRSLAHYRCLKESEYTFDIFEVDAVPLKPVTEYEIIESTVTIKDVDNNKEDK